MNLPVVLSVLLSFSALCYFLLGLRLIGGTRDIGSAPMGVAFLIVSFWVLGGAVEMVASSYVLFSAGSLGHYVGTALLPVMIFLAFREFNGQVTSVRTIISLLIVPVLSIIIAATNFWHEFMWRMPTIGSIPEFPSRPPEFGPWFRFVHAPYGYILMAVSLVMMISQLTAITPSQRRGLLLLAGSILVPLLGVVAYDIGIGPNNIPVIPAILSLMLPIYGWLVIGERIVDFTPLAYETVFQNMQDPVIVVDDDERIIGMNHGAETLLNLRECDALRATLDTVFGGGASEVHAAMATGMPQKMLTGSGRFLHVQVTPISNKNAARRKARVLMFRDVSDVEKAQREMMNSEMLLRTLVDHSVNGIIRLRWVEGSAGNAADELKCIFSNAAAAKFLSIDASSMVEFSAGRILQLAASGMARHQIEDLVRQFDQAVEKRVVMDAEARAETDGDVKWLRIIGEPVGEDVAITIIDVTGRKIREEHMESIARSDPLTGVLNRRGFERDAARRLTESADDETGALLFIDLNDFKQVNDRFGHAIGDQLLTIAAERLRQGLRACDIIGRPGGDEFVALVPDVAASVAEKLAARLTAALEQPYLINDLQLRCAASIGLSLYPEHANTLTGLLRSADAAMYRAKARCRRRSEPRHTGLLEKAG